jgi:hypothetical protein
MTKSKEEWDQAFQLSSAIGKSLQFICAIPNKLACLTAFAKLKTLLQGNPDSEPSMVETVESIETDYDHIEVEEVRVALLRMSNSKPNISSSGASTSSIPRCSRNSK